MPQAEGAPKVRNWRAERDNTASATQLWSAELDNFCDCWITGVTAESPVRELGI